MQLIIITPEPLHVRKFKHQQFHEHGMNVKMTDMMRKAIRYD